MIISYRPQNPALRAGPISRPYPGATAAAKPTASVPFGFSGILDPVHIFRTITEQYFWQIMVMDVTALWIPRIWTSFRRGRIPYDVRQDPTMRDKSPFRQWTYSLYRNIKGLNHKNAMEETLREVEMGPGQTAAYAVVTIGGAALFLGRLGHLMRHDHLEKYNTALVRTIGKSGENTFQAFLKQHARADKAVVSQKLLERYAKEMLLEGGGHFKNAHMAINLNSKIYLSGSDNPLLAFLNDLAKKKGLSDTSKITYHEAMTHWIDRWSRLNQRGWFDQAFNKETNALTSVFGRLAHWYNEKELKLKTAHELDLIKMDFGSGVEKMTAGGVAGCLRKTKSYVQDIYHLADKAVKNLAHNAWPEKMVQALTESAGKTLRSTIGKKLVICWTGILASGLISLYISSIAQRGKSYPANRTFDLKNTAASGLNRPPADNRQAYSPFVGGHA